MLNCNFNKNVFYNNEIAECSYTFDNSKSKMNVKEIEFELAQYININCKLLLGSKRFINNFEVLSNKNSKIVVAGYPEQLADKMALNLGGLSFPVKATKKKKTGLLSSVQVPRSPEEIF